MCPGLQGIPGLGSRWEAADCIATNSQRKKKFLDGEHAFSELKHLLASTPIFVFPDFFRSFFMDTDASATGLGAVLSQVGDDGSNMSVFCFYSLGHKF